MGCAGSFSLMGLGVIVSGRSDGSSMVQDQCTSVPSFAPYTAGATGKLCPSQPRGDGLRQSSPLAPLIAMMLDSK